MAWGLFLLFFTIISPISNLASKTDDSISDFARVCNDNLTFKTNSTNLNFENNVNLLLSVLTSESSHLRHPPLKFFNTSVGRVYERAYGSYLCRNDLSSKQCHNCIVNVTNFMFDLEFGYSDCIGFDFTIQCIVRYAKSSKFSLYEEGFGLTYQPIGNNVTNYKEYNKVLLDTMQSLVEEARYGNWTKANFTTREVEVTGYKEKIYVLVQCTPDISAINCSNCLSELSSRVPNCCNNSQGGVLAHANCLMKYDNRSFFGEASSSFMPTYIYVSFVLLLNIFSFI
ncbi:cysteine-rich repeat secretory protein 38-like [Amaranthus tricolor]|uniref:cysteine-rich repeat secretory protein 38-like n=1 Tax=Amaranthus tricolor TaxID=29722 RepID=UPI00258301CF|nr:cysteine-rich repeat secretory protein 38-like [Amaranthus tricolor]